MRLEQLVNLLQAEREKHVGPIKISASNKSLSSILYMGISDHDIATIIVPKIVEMEISGQYTKDAIKKFIIENNAIDKMPDPIRHAVNDSVEQRRMDSLSRLLSLNTKYTPCVAVAIYNGELIASSNAPNPKENMDDSRLADCLAIKMGFIQDFLQKLIKDVPVGSQLNAKKIKFSVNARVLATDTILHLMSDQYGGVGDVVPTSKPNRHNARGTAISHLENALLKLGQHCLLGIYTNGKRGFTIQEIQTLMQDSMTIVTPNTEVLGQQQLHAEQAILYYLRHYRNLDATYDEEQVPIGISKLCCQACHTVLSRDNEHTSHRGSHGMKFPNVYDIDTESLYQGIDTKLGADLCASDSDSECEYLVKEEESDDEVPTVSSLIAQHQSSANIQAMGKHMLFKPCKAEVETEQSDKQEIPVFNSD